MERGIVRSHPALPGPRLWEKAWATRGGRNHAWHKILPTKPWPVARLENADGYTPIPRHYWTLRRRAMGRDLFPENRKARPARSREAESGFRRGELASSYQPRSSREGFGLRAYGKLLQRELRRTHS